MEHPFTGAAVLGMVPVESEKEESRKSSAARGTGQEGSAPL